jgi:hypothetical protein
MCWYRPAMLALDQPITSMVARSFTPSSKSWPLCGGHRAGVRPAPRHRQADASSGTDRSVSFCPSSSTKIQPPSFQRSRAFSRSTFCSTRCLSSSITSGVGSPIVRLPAFDLVSLVSARMFTRCGQCPGCFRPHGDSHPCLYFGRSRERWIRSSCSSKSRSSHLRPSASPCRRPRETAIIHRVEFRPARAASKIRRI